MRTAIQRWRITCLWQVAEPALASYCDPKSNALFPPDVNAFTLKPLQKSMKDPGLLRQKYLPSKDACAAPVVA